MAATAKSVIQRLTASMPARVIGAYGESQAGNYASGLAFNAFMTMFPLLLGVLSIVGFAVHDQSVHDSVESSLVGIFPGETHDSLRQALSQVQQSAGLLGIISIVGLLWAGTNFFAALEFALDRIFAVKQRDFVRQRLMGLIMMVVLVAAVVVSVGANSLMNLVPYMAALGPVSGAAAMIVLVTLIYRFVPNRTFRLGEIWPGAIIAGICIEAISLAFPLYGRLVHGFSTYGAQFALFFLLATWLAFLSQLILFGAIWNRVRIGDPDSRGIVPTPLMESREVPEPAAAVEKARR